MTLKEWSALTGILPTTPTTETGAVSLVIPDGQGHHEDTLWGISDYRVDRIDRAVFYLIPNHHMMYARFILAGSDEGEPSYGYSPIIAHGMKSSDGRPDCSLILIDTESLGQVWVLVDNKDIVHIDEVPRIWRK